MITHVEYKRCMGGKLPVSMICVSQYQAMLLGSAMQRTISANHLLVLERQVPHSLSCLCASVSYTTRAFTLYLEHYLSQHANPLEIAGLAKTDRCECAYNSIPQNADTTRQKYLGNDSY